MACSPMVAPSLLLGGRHCSPLLKPWWLRLHAPEKHIEWGKGLVQKRAAEARVEELEKEKDQPFARTRDDPELDSMLKNRLRCGDPMTHLVKRKDTDFLLNDLGDDEKMKEFGFIVPQNVPAHIWLKHGVDPPTNRYGIKPGRYWDGVDRNNGYKKDMYKLKNDKQAMEQEAYLWIFDPNPSLLSRVALAASLPPPPTETASVAAAGSACRRSRADEPTEHVLAVASALAPAQRSPRPCGSSRRRAVFEELRPTPRGCHLSPAATSEQADVNVTGLRRIEDGSVISNEHTIKWRICTDKALEFFLQGKLNEVEKLFKAALLDSHAASAVNNLLAIQP
ncbi:hypothetical protein ZWY2020_001272 [Hordeum vulgare]|nr:hypothetical protein ZWY2020_001272 [Hordeum vulgare]